MGRSSKEQASQNRARIVEAASRLFRQHGVDAVSVADVMGALDMTTGGFYKHFASKEALVAEAFALAFEQSSVSWEKVSQRGQDSADHRSGAIVRHYFQKRSADKNCPILAFAPHVETGATDAQTVGAYTKGAEALFKQFRDHMRACGSDLSDPAVEQDAKVLFAAMVGARLLANATGDADWAKSIQATVQRAANDLH